MSPLALNVATDAQQQADAIVRPLEELNRKEEELVGQNKDLRKELQELVTVHNNLQKNFESLSDAYAVMSQSFMTKGKRSCLRKAEEEKENNLHPLQVPLLKKQSLINQQES